MVSTSGNVLDAITYDPYGNILSQTNSANAPRFGFAGGAIDSITGNDQFDERYYNPSDGRFVNPDPLGFQAGDTNLYAYVFNVPTSATDPTGLGGTGTFFDNMPWQPQSGPGLIEQTNSLLNSGRPLFAGAAPVYGLDGNQNAFVALGQAGQMTQGMFLQVGQTYLQAAAFANPCGWLAKGLAGYGVYNSISDMFQNGINFSNASGLALDLLGLLGACFTGDTPLLTPDGDKPIEQFKPGDWVLSAPESHPDAPPEPRQVEAVFTNVMPLLHVLVGGRTIRTTSEHPFYVRVKGWTAAKDLQAGDLLRSHDGQWVAVESVTDGEGQVPVYNLRVADYHTYFVGGRDWGFSVWAHNACVYQAVDPNGRVRYVGIANQRYSNTLAQRLAAARARVPGSQPSVIPGLGRITDKEARQVEQALIKYFGREGKDLGGQLLNRLRGLLVGPRNTRAGFQLLWEVGYWDNPMFH